MLAEGLHDQQVRCLDHRQGVSEYQSLVDTANVGCRVREAPWLRLRSSRRAASSRQPQVCGRSTLSLRRRPAPKREGVQLRLLHGSQFKHPPSTFLPSAEGDVIVGSTSPRDATRGGGMCIGTTYFGSSASPEHRTATTYASDPARPASVRTRSSSQRRSVRVGQDFATEPGGTCPGCLPEPCACPCPCPGLGVEGPVRTGSPSRSGT